MVRAKPGAPSSAHVPTAASSNPTDAPVIIAEQHGGELVVRIRVDSPSRDERSSMGPILISRGNVEGLTGLRWRSFDEAMRRLGVPRMKLGGAAAYEASESLRALREDASRRSPSVSDSAECAAVDEDAAYRNVVAIASRSRGRR